MRKRKCRKRTSRAETATGIGGVARHVVSPTEWRRARATITAREKKHMRAGDALAAAPYADIARLREHMGWHRWPWYSTTAEFNRELDASDESGNSFGLNAFYRDRADVYRTHFVARRGLEAFGTAWSFYDVTPLGRQETWQDAPAGSPQAAPYAWWRRHGEYDADAVGARG